VYKLPAAHYFVYENGKMYVRRFWTANSTRIRRTLSGDKLDEWCTIRGRPPHCGRKVGSFLSGGVDSSYIALC
jgi:asparagine synthase (glutamine-hydrolysing)